MAEQRPYRAPGAAAARLQQVKKYAAVTLGLSFIIVNWMTTQHAAWLMGDSPRLGPGLFALPWLGPVYAPWKWMVMGVEVAGDRADAALWMISIHEVLYPMAPLDRARGRSDCGDAARMASEHGGPPRFGAMGDHQGRKESRVFRDPDLDCEASAARGDAAASAGARHRPKPGSSWPHGGIGVSAGFCAMADNRMCWYSRRPAAARAPAW